MIDGYKSRTNFEKNQIKITTLAAYRTFFERKSTLQEMKIELQRINDAFHMEATNEQGNTVYIDGSPAIGGGNLAMRPMQMVLSALGGCSAIDIINILRKQRQPLEDFRVQIEAEREEGMVPSLFTKIHVHYLLHGDLKENKVEKAVNMSMEKLCSVKMILDKTAEISWSYEIIRNS